jgi:outer membrane protein insertion porin family
MRRSALVQAAVAVLALSVSACRSAARGPYDEHEYALEFRGADGLSGREARRAVRPDLERFTTPGLAPLALEDAAWSLERVYKRLGYPYARVLGEEDRTPGGRPLARLVVDEGPRVTLGRVIFNGARALDPDDLELLVEGPERGLFGGRRWFVQDELEAGLETVLELYRSRGYLDARLSPPVIDFGTEGTRADVSVDVEEGRAWRLAQVELVGAPPELEKKLRAVVRHELSAPASPALPRVLRGRCEDVLGRHGYADARVNVVRETRDEEGGIELVLGVETGQTVRIGRVAFSGNVRTSEKLLRDALEIEEGDRYDSAEFVAASRRLQSLDLFSSVRLDLEGEGPKRTLVVTVEELSRREFYVEPGYGSYERYRLLGGWKQRDWLRTGYRLELEGVIGPLARSGKIGLSDARFLGTDDRADLTFFGNRREEPSFTKSELGSRFTLTHRVSSNLETSAAYSLRQSRVFDVDATVPDPGALETVDISSVTLAASHDTRDEPFAPTDGHLGRLSVEYAPGFLGSELEFLRTIWTASIFFDLWSGAVLGSSWRGGSIMPRQGSTTIPLQERFFNGGENTVRSFRENELGPKDANGDPIGGEAFNVLSLELRQHLLGRLDGVLFFDTGNVVEKASDTFTFDDLEIAVGTGLRYLLPVGPIRLDVGFNPGHDDDEDAYVIHLSVGMAF